MVILVIFFDALGDMFSFYVGNHQAILELSEKCCQRRGTIFGSKALGNHRFSSGVSSKFISSLVRFKDIAFKEVTFLQK